MEGWVVMDMEGAGKDGGRGGVSAALVVEWLLQSAGGLLS